MFGGVGHCPTPEGAIPLLASLYSNLLSTSDFWRRPIWVALWVSLNLLFLKNTYICIGKIFNFILASRECTPVYWEKCILIYNVKNLKFCLKFRIILFDHEAAVMKDPVRFTFLKNFVIGTFNNVYQA